MPIRKKGNVEIQTSANGTKTKSTGFTFYSYDKKSAALYFQFREEDGEPTDLSEATVHLVFILNDEKFIPNKEDIEIWLAVLGTARYIIPDNLLCYEGKVTSYVYLDFSDGSHTDEGHFTFEIKRSLITDVIPEAGDKYVKDFEDVKAEVQEAADGAKETISQKVTEVSDTSDSAISKVNQVADDTIKTASEAKSDVQSKADEASYSIDEAVKSTESARDEAVKTMNELDYSDRNLLKGTSDEWEKTNDEFFGYSGARYPLVKSDLSEGETVTYSVEIDNTIDQQNDSDLFSVLRFTLNNGKIKGFEGNRIPSGEKGVSSVTCVVPSDVKETRHVKVAQHPVGTQKVGAYRKPTLNHGPLAAPWQPAAEDIVTKSELEQIKQAIINLGGSV